MNKFKQFGIYVNNNNVLIILDSEIIKDNVLTMKFTVDQFETLSNKCINETIMRSDGVSFINHQANLIELNDEFLKNTVYLGQITDEELLNMLDKIREFLIN